MSAIFGPAHRQRQLRLETWYGRVHPHDRAPYRAELGRENLEQGYTIEYRYKHALSGEYRWARETAAPPYDTASGRRLFDSYILDITEQKRAQEVLRVSEQRYRAVVEDQTEYILRFDRKGRAHVRQRRALPAVAEKPGRAAGHRLPGLAGGDARAGAGYGATAASRVDAGRSQHQL